MSKNIYKTPNSSKNQLNKIKQRNTSILSDTAIFGNNLSKFFDIFTKNTISTKLTKLVLNIKESIYAVFFRNNENSLPLKIIEPIEKTILNKIKPNDLIKFEILNRQKTIVGRFTKRILEQALKKNQIGRAI